jgi:hypothetical protein
MRMAQHGEHALVVDKHNAQVWIQIKCRLHHCLKFGSHLTQYCAEKLDFKKTLKEAPIKLVRP